MSGLGILWAVRWGGHAQGTIRDSGRQQGSALCKEVPYLLFYHQSLQGKFLTKHPRHFYLILLGTMSVVEPRGEGKPKSLPNDLSHCTGSLSPVRAKERKRDSKKAPCSWRETVGLPEKERPRRELCPQHLSSQGWS